MKFFFTACISILFCAAVLPVYAENGAVKPYTLEDVVNEPYLSQLKAEKKIRFVHTENGRKLEIRIYGTCVGKQD